MKEIRMDEDYRNKGYGTEAMHTYYQYFFEKNTKCTVVHYTQIHNSNSVEFHKNFDPRLDLKKKITQDQFLNTHEGYEWSINKKNFCDEKAFESRKERIKAYCEKDQNYLKNTSPSGNIGCVEITEKSPQIGT